MKDAGNIERRLKLQDLRMLMHIVEAGSMSKAAERLATSQPAISRAVGDLEHTLGVRLLDRGPRGIEPTPYGRALIKRGTAIFDELRLGVRDLESLSDPAAGEVRIGVPVGLSTSFLTAVIDHLSLRYPRVVCHIVVEDRELPRKLEEREVDLLLVYVLDQGGPPMEVAEMEVLFSDRLCIGAAASNPWVRRRKIELAELMGEPWVLPPLSSFQGEFYAAAVRAAGCEWPSAAVITTTSLTRMALVAKGRFLTIGFESILKLVADRAEVKPLRVNWRRVHRPVGIVTLKNRTLTPAAQLFIASAREIAKPLARANPG